MDAPGIARNAGHEPEEGRSRKADDSLLRVIAAALGIAIVAGALGRFAVWRRIACFGDATAHAAILGVGCRWRPTCRPSLARWR